LAPPARVLDVPCGNGRHSALLAQQGFDVVSLDIEPERVNATNALDAGSGTIAAQVGDADEGLPFEPSSFDLVMVIHFVSGRILVDAQKVLRSGGFLIFETFGRQAGNWKRLPKPGAIRQQVDSCFELLTYAEKLAGPSDQAAAVKLLARKR
jgi:SAM-dependent methyltransferase